MMNEIPEPLPFELLIATRNPGKLDEVRSLLRSLPLHLRSLTEFPATTEVDETGATFAENAILKAQSYAQQTGMWALADDSGLEVYALGGAPGIYSARYAGEGAADADRITRLLAELSGTEDQRREARFTCSVAIATPEARIINVSHGTCEGRIAHAPRGDNGFGYDPIFVPDGYKQSFGELSSEIKDVISHRARALEATRQFLCDHFNISA